jgi:translation initiation factor 3 subunit J
MCRDRWDQSDWEASSDDEEEKPKPTSTAAPAKKKGTLKQKLAEKAAAAAARGDDEDEEYDEDAVLDPREKARLDKERELNADLKNAADLLGAAALGGHPDFLLYIWKYTESFINHRHVF